jgi:polyhydroxybutyrate depolymerase
MRRPSLRPLLVLLVLTALLAGCGTTIVAPGSFVVGGLRPALVVPPPDHDPTVPTPLLVVLHGYQSSADQIEDLFPLATAAEVLGIAVVRPEGAIDSLSRRFWNASEACCNLYGFPVDDVGYLTGVIDEIADRMAVSEVMLFGHSNGGFMAYRLACAFPERFTAVVAVAGGLDTDPVPDCGAGGPARVLHLHGTEDRVIRYAGGSVSDLPIPLMPDDIPPYTGAEATVGSFAGGAGCGALVAGTPFDLDLRVDGAETVPLEASCPDGRRVALWRMVDSGHEPRPGSGFAARVLWFALGW